MDSRHKDSPKAHQVNHLDLLLPALQYYKRVKVADTMDKNYAGLGDFFQAAL